MARNSARSSIHSAAAVKKASTRNSAACTGLRTVMTQLAAMTRIAAKIQKAANSNMVWTHRYAASAARSRAICSSYRSPTARSISLV